MARGRGLHTRICRRCAFPRRACLSEKPCHTHSHKLRTGPCSSSPSYQSRIIPHFWDEYPACDLDKRPAPRPSLMSSSDSGPNVWYLLFWAIGRTESKLAKTEE